MNVRRSSLRGACAAFALFLLTGCGTEDARGPTASFVEGLSPVDMNIVLEGEGADTGLPLSATVTVSIEDPTTAHLVVTNTSPAESSSVPYGPVLTRLGFNLADGPDPSCLSVVVDDDRFAVPRRVKPFCGRTPRLGPMFAYGLDAENPAPHNGIARGETLAITLVVADSCDFTFSRSAFVDAPSSPTSGVLAQWAAKFQVVGPGGEDSGCAHGDVPEDVPFTRSEFKAYAAEKVGLPLGGGDPAISLEPVPPLDTRAGSVELNFVGDVPWAGNTDPRLDTPFGGVIANLRNGYGDVIDQVIREFTGGDGTVHIVLPDGVTVVDSNDGFDPGSTDRVTIATEVVVDDAEPPVDDANKWFTITWEDPGGLDTARMLLAVHVDTNLNSDLGDDPWVTLFHRDWTIDGAPDGVAPVVLIVAETATSLTVQVNVQDAHDYVFDAYAP